jgi:hypothetical protein
MGPGFVSPDFRKCCRSNCGATAASMGPGFVSPDFRG